MLCDRFDSKTNGYMHIFHETGVVDDLNNTLLETNAKLEEVEICLLIFA
jgi:hypothetical protein